MKSLKGLTISYDPVSLPVAVHDYMCLAGLNIRAEPDPLFARKACKTMAEVDGFRHAHFLDGLALSRFFYWLETQAKRTQLYESELAQELGDTEQRHNHISVIALQPLLAGENMEQ